MPPLPAVIAVASAASKTKFGKKVLGKARGVAAGLAKRVGFGGVAKAVKGGGGRRRRRSLSAKDIGNLLLAKQIFGARSPAMTVIAFKKAGRF